MDLQPARRTDPMSTHRPHLPSVMALQSFESAARHLNFRRAAEELHVTQGAVSQQIRHLEALLGFALFARVRQRVLLTSAGARYLGEVRRLLVELGQVTHQAMATGSKELLNLAAVPTFAAKWLAPRLPAFLAALPELNLNVVSRSAPFDFSEEPFDAAIHYGEPVWPGAVTELLMPEEMLPVAQTGYCRQLRLRKARDLPRATLLQQFTRPSAWSDWFMQQGITADKAYQGPRFDSFNMILEAVCAGAGAALLPRFLVEPLVTQGTLSLLSPHPLASPRGYYFVCPEAKIDVPAVRAFHDWLLAQTGHLNSSTTQPIKKHR
jgi:LysR family glycine cleavage system transcriptional activator